MLGEICRRNQQLLDIQIDECFCGFCKFRSSTDIELVFSGEMSKSPLDCVLCYRDTIALKTPKSREKNEGRRYFDYCGITTTEYKWTTSYLKIIFYSISSFYIPSFSIFFRYLFYKCVYQTHFFITMGAQRVTNTLTFRSGMK